MLLSNKRFICVLITLLLFISSCSINEPENNTNNTTELDSQGIVSLKLPTMTSFIEAYKPEGKTKSNSRAILSSDDIKIKIFQDGKELDPLTGGYYKNVMVDLDDYDNNSYFSFKLKPGKYSLEIEVFNPHQEDEPVVTGKSEEFEVRSRETTPVTIVATPVNPVVIEDGIELILKKSDYIATTINEFNGVNTGSEKWYQYTATSELTKIDIKSDIADMSLFLIAYDKNGNYKIVNKDFIFPSVIGDTYYLGTVYIDFPEDSTDIAIDRDLVEKSITIAPFVGVEDDNKSIDTAEPITIGEPKFLVLDKNNDVDFFKVNLKKGSKYQISFNFPWNKEVSEKAVYDKNGVKISDFKDYWGDYSNYYDYEPLEDETIYISIKLDFDVMDQYWSPAIFVHDKTNQNIYINAYEEFSFIKGYKIEARIINNEDNTFTSQIFNIESENEQDFYTELDNVKLSDNVSLVFLLKDFTDKTVGISRKFDLRELEYSYIFFSFDFDHIDIQHWDVFNLPEVTGEKKTLYFDILELTYSDVIEKKEGDLIVEAIVTKAPKDSALLNKNLIVSFEELRELHYFDFTADVSGKYEITVEASNPYTKTYSYSFDFLTKDETEGVVNVKFE